MFVSAPYPVLSLRADHTLSVSKKHTATGRPHEEAFAHLRQLGLKEKVFRSDAQCLGVEVRKLLNQPFKTALRAQRNGTTQG